jgi:hypothetical protein
MQTAKDLVYDRTHRAKESIQGHPLDPKKAMVHSTLRMSGDGIQTHHARVPGVKRVPVSVRNIIQAYLNMVDWRHIQTGGPQGDIKDWSTSPNFVQW